MILKPNNFAIVPCIILSIILHGAVFFVIYQKNKQETFIQIPFEVSFYAPYANNVKEKKAAAVVQKNNKFLPVESAVEKQDVVEKKQDSPKTTSDIITAKKTEEKKKESKGKTKEHPTENNTSGKEKTTETKKDEVTDSTDNEESKTSSKADDSSEYSKGIMLENKNFKYSYYTGAILKKIRRYWQDSNINVLRTVVYFKIEKNGTVSKLKIFKSSKNSAFDKNALRAVELASPFPPLPDGYTENNLGVYFEFKTT